MSDAFINKIVIVIIIILGGRTFTEQHFFGI